MDRARSRFVDDTPPPSLVYTIKQSPTTLEFSSTTDGRRIRRFVAIPDGREHDAGLSPEGARYYAQSRWEGSTLIVDFRELSAPDNLRVEAKWTATYRVSQDGRRLFVDRKGSWVDGKLEQHIELEK